MKRLIITGLAALLPLGVYAQSQEGWFLRAYGGYSQHSDIDADTTGVATVSTQADISVDGGFTAGAGAGYRYGENWAVELAWEYRSNDTETDLGGETQYPDGNLASSTFYLNGYYHFAASGRWDPYIGAGLGWLQEVDIDLEGNGPERSYSGDGDTGFQLFAGANYDLTEHLVLQGEIRYAYFGDLDLEGEGGAAGEFSSVDYDPLTLQLGLLYRF
jgi:opacity protein-like surface antigen